ncbi:hypothetical protein Fot_04839 [Forsythia ovata]|uniref:Uncharacterized protein n=1 Tax=Forsythia ovata TaxID=205694 RepID=A0ABD1WNF1_9LAMI
MSLLWNGVFPAYVESSDKITRLKNNGDNIDKILYYFSKIASILKLHPKKTMEYIKSQASSTSKKYRCSTKAAVDNNNNPEAEESSWTFYIQEFMCENGEKSCFSYDYETHSLLSDAASSAVKRFVNKNCKPIVFLNNLKKKKYKEQEVDEYLLDTASSLVNSLKNSES